MSTFLTLTPPVALSNPDLAAYVLLDLCLIIILARVMGHLVSKIGQPRVVGEILAGILLGPTLLGPTLSLVVIPAQARPIMHSIATLGLILFMFLAGLEFNLDSVKGRTKQAGGLALLAVAIPAGLGFALALAIHNPTYYGSAGENFLPFALLLGASLAVTAFPVMAHILMERGELNTPLGALSVATASIMSVLMFTYIAFAQAAATPGSYQSLGIQIAAILLFGFASWYVVRPLLARLFKGQGDTIGPDSIALIFVGLIFFGFLGDRLGIHALVGGFVWGMILPTAPAFRGALMAKVRDVALIVFLPVFFALAGFATDLKLITLSALPVVGLTLAAAVAGKFLAAVPARAFGLSWREVGSLGALFNTRGLLLLVVGLIGLQNSIITKMTFTVLVIVALVTNLMTLPLLKLWSSSRK